LAVIVLAHGAWSAAWAWKKIRPLMTAAGHQFFTPTYTGLGERAHLASPSNELETHIDDVLGVLKFETCATSCCSVTATAAWWRPEWLTERGGA
jgi:hypothetical protein